MIFVRVQGFVLREGYYEWNGSPDLSVKVSGHAGFAKKGEDIVCAAASALVQALSVSLAAKNIVQSVSRDDGIMFISIEWENMKDNEKRSVTSGFDLMIHGFRAMAESYPENITISIE